MGSIRLQEKLFFRQPRTLPGKDRTSQTSRRSRVFRSPFASLDEDRESGLNPLLPWAHQRERITRPRAAGFSPHLKRH